MSEVTNYLVSNLPAYVQENRDLIIKNFALVGAGTRKRIGLQTGVKRSAYLNYLDLGITLQDGSGCGFNALDRATLTQRTLTTATIKHDGKICPETLLGKYAEYLVRVKATENDLPFEQYLIEGMTREVNKAIEKLIWLGDHTQSSDATIKWIDGIIYQLSNDSDCIDVNIASGKTAYEGIMAVYAAMPEEVLERGGVIFVSPAIYRAFLMDMVKMNYYHYAGPQDAAPEEFVLPGTDVKVVKTPGLAGNLNIVGTFADNLVYGTDGENDAEVMDIWWSQDDRVFKWEAKWNSGIAYRFPALNVLGTFAATPVATTGANAALATIAANSANIKDYTTVLGGIKSGTDNLAGIKTDNDAIAGCVVDGAIVTTAAA